MRVLSLFTGLGSHDLGLTWAGYNIVGQCEIDDYCSRVLAKHWPQLLRWKDVKDVQGSHVRECVRKINLITGGFPCTGISNIGKGEGYWERSGATEASGLFQATAPGCSRVKPGWLLLKCAFTRNRAADVVLARWRSMRVPEGLARCSTFQSPAPTEPGMDIARLAGARLHRQHDPVDRRYAVGI